MSIKDVTLRSWKNTSGANLPGDSEKILRDFADQIRNIKSIYRTASLDKGFQVYTYGPENEYESVSSVDNQGTSLATLNIAEIETGTTTFTLVGDKHLEFPNGQRVYGVSSSGNKSLMGEVFSCAVNISTGFTVLTVVWDKLGYATTFQYEKDMSTAGVGCQLGFDAAPANGISGKIKVKNQEKNNIKVKLRTFGYLDPKDPEPEDKKSQVIHPFGTMDPTLVQAYTSSYFVSLQIDSMSREKKVDGSDGAGLPDKKSFVVTGVRKMPEFFEFSLMDSPDTTGANPTRYVIYSWSITYAMRGA
jgi:hypothetical protein